MDMDFSKVDWLASVGVILLATALVLSVGSGWIHVTDVSSAVAFALVGGMATCLSALIIPRLIGDKDKQLAKEFAKEKQKLEEIDRDRRTIYEAIKEWIQPPEIPWQIRSQQEPPWLGEKLPKYAQKIDDCLSRNYPSIWADLQEFRSRYTELMSLDTTIPEEFLERIDGVENVKLYLLDARKDSIRHVLLARQRQLIQQINLEIVERLDTELKC
jgi:hypothetical protein